MRQDTETKVDNMKNREKGTELTHVTSSDGQVRWEEEEGGSDDNVRDANLFP